MGEVTTYAMYVALDDGVSTIIMYLSATILLGGSFGFRWCGIFDFFLMLKVGNVDLCHQFVNFGSEVLVF